VPRASTPSCPGRPPGHGIGQRAICWPCPGGAARTGGGMWSAAQETQRGSCRATSSWRGLPWRRTPQGTPADAAEAGPTSPPRLRRRRGKRARPHPQRRRQEEVPVWGGRQKQRSRPAPATHLCPPTWQESPRPPCPRPSEARHRPPVGQAQ